MQIVGTVITLAGIIGMLVCWLTGIINYFKIFGAARRAGRSFWDLYWFGTYRFAFNEMKGSKETKRMLFGFVGIFVSVVLAVVGGMLLESGPRH